MKEIHISIFNPDNLQLNKLYHKLNRYTAKVTADPFEPNMCFHVDGKDIFGEKLELQCLPYDTVITHTFPNMSIENLYVCITIILSLLPLKELNKEEDMICFTLDKQDDGNVTLTAYYLIYNSLLGTVFRVFSLYSSIFIFRNTYPFLFYASILSTTIILSTQPT